MNYVPLMQGFAWASSVMLIFSTISRRLGNRSILNVLTFIMASMPIIPAGAQNIPDGFVTTMSVVAGEALGFFAADRLQKIRIPAARFLADQWIVMVGIAEVLNLLQYFVPVIPDVFRAIGIAGGFVTLVGVAIRLTDSSPPPKSFPSMALIGLVTIDVCAPHTWWLGFCLLPLTIIPIGLARNILGCQLVSLKGHALATMYIAFGLCIFGSYAAAGISPTPPFLLLSVLSTAILGWMYAHVPLREKSAT